MSERSWNIIRKGTWSIIRSGKHTLMLSHSNNSRLCGYVCKVNEKYHCFTCGEDMPEMYEEMLLLGDVFVLPIKNRDQKAFREWQKKCWK